MNAALSVEDEMSRISSRGSVRLLAELQTGESGCDLKSLLKPERRRVVGAAYGS